MANRIVNVIEAIKLNREGIRVRVINNNILNPWYGPHSMSDEVRFMLTYRDIIADWEVEEVPLKFEYEMDLKEYTWALKFINQLSEIGGKWRVTCEQVKDEK